MCLAKTLHGWKGTLTSVVIPFKKAAAVWSTDQWHLRKLHEDGNYIAKWAFHQQEMMRLPRHNQDFWSAWTIFECASQGHFTDGKELLHLSLFLSKWLPPYGFITNSIWGNFIRMEIILQSARVDHQAMMRLPRHNQNFWSAWSIFECASQGRFTGGKGLLHLSLLLSKRLPPYGLRINGIWGNYMRMEIILQSAPFINR
jgi:hypothetical protein